MQARIVFFLALLAYGYGQDEPELPDFPDLDIDDGPVEELYLNNGLYRGYWGQTDLCKNESWVSSFEVKYEAEGHIDNTGINSVKLYCQNAEGTITSSLVSTEGRYGKWMGIRACAGHEYMTGMRADVMQEQGSLADDQGLVNLEMKCSDGTIYNGRYDQEHQKKGEKGMDGDREKVILDGREMEAVPVKINLNGEVGVYSEWAECSGVNRICGLTTMVEPESTFTDDAGCCNLMMYCCDDVLLH